MKDQPSSLGLRGWDRKIHLFIMLSFFNKTVKDHEIITKGTLVKPSMSNEVRFILLISLCNTLLENITDRNLVTYLLLQFLCAKLQFFGNRRLWGKLVPFWFNPFQRGCLRGEWIVLNSNLQWLQHVFITLMNNSLTRVEKRLKIIEKKEPDSISNFTTITYRNE